MADVAEQKLGNEVYDIKAKSVVDQNNGKLKFWSGVQADYDDITAHDSKTQYITTDTKRIYLGDVLIGGGGGVPYFTVVDGKLNMVYETV